MKFKIFFDLNTELLTLLNLFEGFHFIGILPNIGKKDWNFNLGSNFDFLLYHLTLLFDSNQRILSGEMTIIHEKIVNMRLIRISLQKGISLKLF